MIWSTKYLEHSSHRFISSPSLVFFPRPYLFFRGIVLNYVKSIYLYRLFFESRLITSLFLLLFQSLIYKHQYCKDERKNPN